MKRLYVTTIICGAIGTIFDVPNNFVGTLLLTTVALTVIEIFRENKKRGGIIAGILLLYQFSLIVFMQLIGIRSRESYFAISILGISSFEGTSTIFIVLGVIFYLTRQKKPLLACSYLVFCGIYYICATTAILNRGEDWLARRDLNMIADLFGILRQLIGFGRFQVGGNPFTENYQWMMVFALPFLLCYNGKKGGDSKM